MNASDYLVKGRIKYKLLFVIPSFAVGGVSSSLFSLINSLDRKRFEIVVFCRDCAGAMKDVFLEGFNVLPENVWMSMRIREASLFKRVSCFLLRTLRILARLIGIDLYKVYCFIGGHELKTMDYDAVICFHEGISSIVSHYPAKRKIAWVHCDYSRQLSMVGKSELNTYEKFDSIVCVSEYGKKVFVGHYPSLKDKTVSIHNIIDVDKIVYLSRMTEQLDASFDYSSFTIVSVGRLDPVKQFSAIPKIAAEIKRMVSIPFKWYIIGGTRGYKEEEERILNGIIEQKVKDNVILLGEKRNVYPYIAKANLYVCTSLSESFPLAINEAKVLRVPVVSNSFPSASESIVDGQDGRIAHMDKLPLVISELMMTPMVVNKSSINNQKAINSFYKLIDKTC